ncbi:MAG: hypothetical protein JW874_04385 [Spirochaetales bacterium]|nr:hypothetical protein [Spirochaetales bacterium]
MKKMFFLCLFVCAILIIPSIAAAQQNMSDGSMQGSSEDSAQDSSQDSSQDSFQESSQQSTDESSQDSTENSSENSSESTTNEELSAALLIGGIVIAVGVTVGVLISVRASNVRKEDALRIQDQIYKADGKEYSKILAWFEIEDRDLIRANDDLVSDGYTIGSNREAADYLALLMLRCAGKSDKAKAGLLVQ